MITHFISESGRIIFKIKTAAEADIKKILMLSAGAMGSSALMNSSYNNNSKLNNSQGEDMLEFDIRQIKDNTSMSREDWQKASDILSRFEYCGEEYLINAVKKIEEEEDEIQRKIEKDKKEKKVSNYEMPKISSKDFKAVYESIVKALILQLEKDNNNKIWISFSESPIDADLEAYFDNHFKKKAYVLVSPSDNFSEILQETVYDKDPKKNKKLKTPHFEIEKKTARVYTSRVTHISPVDNIDYGYTILIEDENAEFYICMKLIECFLRAIIVKFDTEVDCKSIFIRYYEEFKIVMKKLRSTLDIPNRILYYDIPIFEPDEEENQENKDE